MLVTDEIIVFKNGKIIEMGTHNELIAKNGEYKNYIQHRLKITNIK